ncbi:MAG: VTT domain-containing protein, partial [Patescibacteria group bacterium]
MYRRYIIGGVLVALLAALFFVSRFLQDLFFVVIEDIGAFAAENTATVTLFFVLFAALSAMISPFSSAPIVPVAVALWGVETTIALLLLGWLLGDIFAYAIGRFAGHPIARQLIREEELQKYELYFSKHATFVRALLARLVFPAEIGYGFGLIRYNFGAYMFVTFIAEALFAVLTVEAADALISLRPAMFIGWILAIFAAIGCCYLLFRFISREKKI